LSLTKARESSIQRACYSYIALKTAGNSRTLPASLTNTAGRPSMASLDLNVNSESAALDAHDPDMRAGTAADDDFGPPKIRLGVAAASSSSESVSPSPVRLENEHLRERERHGGPPFAHALPAPIQSNSELGTLPDRTLNDGFPSVDTRPRVVRSDPSPASGGLLLPAAQRVAGFFRKLVGKPPSAQATPVRQRISRFLKTFVTPKPRSGQASALHAQPFSSDPLRSRRGAPGAVQPDEGSNGSFRTGKEPLRPDQGGIGGLLQVMDSPTERFSEDKETWGALVQRIVQWRSHVVPGEDPNKVSGEQTD